MTDDFEILAFNGITGECLTTADDWTQRLKETPYDPLGDVRQEHETWLAELEGLAVEAITRANWTPVLEHLNEIMAWQDGKLHEAQKSKANAEVLSRPSADPSQTTDFQS